jgi:hypothetical protein
MKIPFLPSPRDEYDKLNKEIAALDKYLAPVNDARLERQLALDKARATYMASPSPENLNAWETARQRAVGMKNSDSFGSTFSHLETIRGDVESFVNTQREALKSSPKAMQIYMRCLQEIAANTRKAIASKREEIVEKLRGVGAAVDIDQVAPLPLWTGRANHLHNLADQLETKIASPAVLMRQSLVDEARAAIEADHLNAPAPTPVKPRQQQAWPPGTTFAAAGLPEEPAVAPEPVNSVPAEVNQAIKAKLIREQNEHFERQQAQMVEQLEAQRLASLANLQAVEA